MRKVIGVVLMLLAMDVMAWEAKISNILHHRTWIAVSLTPDPGKMSCDAGSPYLVEIKDTVAHQQLFSMLLAAQASGKTITGYDSDPCSAAIWGVSRPTIERLNLKTD